jgi:class 3 adenylate cyclase/tetratricopeptide (TPR) repeat protein
MMDRSKSPRQTEPRHATVLFADLTGYTALIERLGAEQSFEITSGYLSLLDRVAHKHAGFVERIIGDEIMVIFGVPRAMEDAPRAAVNAAIEMRNEVRRHYEEGRSPVPLEVHTGINSGLMVSGEVGGEHVEYTVMGDVVNTAKRLTSEAKAGQIFVGHETWHATKDSIEYRALPPMSLKGKQEDVPVYEVLSAEPSLHRSRIARDRRIFSDVVGRDRELASLRQAVSSLQSGKGSIVSLVGEPGLGKTRLVAELRESYKDQGLLFLEGRSRSIGQSLSFHPFSDLLRDWAGIAEHDGGTLALQKLENALADLLGDDAPKVAPFVARLMGVHLSEEAARQVEGIKGEGLEKLMLASVRQILSAISSRQPCVLIFEDLHWSDASSIRLLEQLLALVEECPILFLLAARWNHPDTTQQVLGTIEAKYAHRHKLLCLEPLGEEAARQLVDNLCSDSDIPGTIRSLICERALGNPFYAGEVIHGLIDEGVLRYEGDSLRATEKIRSVSIPATIREVIMSRVDRLEPRVRTLLQTLAVSGRSSPAQVVEKLASEPDHLSRDLEHLLSVELLDHQGDAYAFKHALTHQATYESILGARREQLHQRVAEVIEDNFKDKLPAANAMLAYHFSMAKDLEAAEEYLFEAGDEAARSAASDEALYFFQEASKYYLMIESSGGDPWKRAKLEKNIAVAYHNRGDGIEAGEHFTSALTLLGEPPLRGRLRMGVRFARTLTVVLANLYAGSRAGRKSTANDTQREVIELMTLRAEAQTTAGDPIEFLFNTMETHRVLNGVDPASVVGAGGLLSGLIGAFSWQGGFFGLGERALHRAEAHVRREDAAEILMFQLMSYLHHLLRGDWEEEHQIEEAVVEGGLRHGQLWQVTNYLGLAAEQRVHQGRFAEAEQLIGKLSRIASAYSFDLAKGAGDYAEAFLLLQRGETERALRAINAYYREHREDNLNIAGLSERARIQLLLDDTSGAAESLSRVETILKRTTGTVAPYYLSMYVRSRLLLDVVKLASAIADGDAATRRAQKKRASASARKALRICDKVASRRPEVYRTVGTLHWLLERKARAVRYWERSLELGSHLGMLPDVGRTHREIGHRLLIANDTRSVGDLDAEGHLEAARTIFESLELEADLKQLPQLAPQATPA